VDKDDFYIGLLAAVVLMFAGLYAVPFLTYFKDEEQIEEEEKARGGMLEGAKGPSLFLDSPAGPADGPGLFDDESVEESLKAKESVPASEKPKK
jgi:hypothetical protein